MNQKTNKSRMREREARQNEDGAQSINQTINQSIGKLAAFQSRREKMARNVEDRR